MTAANYTLELLHISDQGTGLTSYLDVPRLSAVVNALKAQDLFDDGIADNTLFLSSGNVLIPGVFFGASEQVYGLRGAADILIQNALGLQAVAFGNHEFDSGPALIATQIAGVSGNVSIPGTSFPYLSCNLNFTPDSTLYPLQVPKNMAPVPKRITSSVVFTVGGEKIGVVGATTPYLLTISSPGPLIWALPQGFDERVSADLDALAAIIQKEVNGLIAANSGMNKVILLSNMRLISIELALAARLKNVDIIVAGGSKTRLFDSNDRVRAGDSVNGTYPIFVQDANNKTTAIVNTDGGYKYVGRLVIGFDNIGHIIPSSYNVSASGAYATDDVGVAMLNATGAAVPDPIITNVIRQIEPLLTISKGDILGYSDVFLNGQRDVSNDPLSMMLDGVRTQQTNLGDLSADANLWYAKATDPSVVISLRHAGGIRSSIGKIDILPGETTQSRMPVDEFRAPNGTIIARGGIPALDIENSLRFNNALVLVNVNAFQLRSLLENGISALPVANGRMCQVGGVSFTFNTTLPVGGRIRDITITSTVPQRKVLVNGVVVGDPNKTFRMVTLDFLLAGSDGYIFPTTGRQNVTTDPGGKSSLSAIGTERDAMAEYLLQFHGIATPFKAADTDRKGDKRIIDLAFAPVAVSPVKAPVKAPVKSPIKAPVKTPVKAPVINPALRIKQGECKVDSKCGLCEGDCDSDDECEGALVCFLRKRQSFLAVPGCGGGTTDASPRDYCVDPNRKQ